MWAYIFAMSLARSNGHAAGEQLEEHAAERVDVGAGVGGLAADLLGRGVVGGADEQARPGQAALRRLRESPKSVR